MSNVYYDIRVSKRQLELLSYACDRLSRIICGQDWTYQEFMEEAWEKRCKDATGKMMDDDFEGGWYEMRHDAEAICKQIKKRFWGMEWNAMYGVGYDDTADILFDLHQVIRHQLWIDRPESEKSHITVDASEAMRFGSEPLAEVSVSLSPECFDVDVMSLPFSQRTKNCLRGADIYTLGDLLRVKKLALLRIRGFGIKSLKEIEDYYVANSLEWGDEDLQYRENTWYCYHLKDKERN